MATVTALTALRMLAIEAASVIDGDIVGDNLILTKHDGSTINAGNVRGPQGVAGPAGSIPRVAALPGAPVDGDDISFVVDATNDICWHLKYHAGGGTYKWVYQGGPPLGTYLGAIAGLTSAEITAVEQTNSSAFANLATTGPWVQPPLAGEYLVEFGAKIAPANAQQILKMSVGVYTAADGAVVAAGAGDQIECEQVDATIARTSVNVGIRPHKMTLAALGNRFWAKYAESGGELRGSFSNRWLRVSPLRVG